jgi:hypothetical protein
VHRYVVVVRSILLDLRSFMLKQEFDLKNRGKILKEVKLCDLKRVL